MGLDPLDDLIRAQAKKAEPTPAPALLSSELPVVDTQVPPADLVPVQTCVPGVGFDFKEVKAKLKRSLKDDLTVDVTKAKPLKGVIPTGHGMFDRASGIGGIAMGCITEMFGPESVGKSTIALMASARAQARGIPVIWIDQEHSFDPAYAKSFGMILDDERKLWVTAPDNIEDSFTIAGAALDGGFKGLIIYDSLGAGMPKEVIEENAMGEMRPGLKSSIIGICLQQIEPQVNRNQAGLVFINQLRANIRIPQRGEQRLANAEFGEEASITTPGGWVMKHIASVRIQLRKLHARIWEEREKKSEIEVNFVKNKLAGAFGKCTMTLRFGSGFEPSV